MITTGRVRSFGRVTRGKDKDKNVSHVPDRLSSEGFQGHCGVLPFLIKRNGDWLYKGSLITRKSMVCLFASALKRDAQGRYVLQTPTERGDIEVEDVPFIIVGLSWKGLGKNQVISFFTNVDECVTLGREHPMRLTHNVLNAEPVPYLHLRDGEGEYAVEGRVNRSTYYELVALAEPGVVNGRKVMGVWSDGVFFSLGEFSEESKGSR